MPYTVLIAEDDIDIANVLSMYLESNSYNVITCGNGKSALEILQAQQIDLVILDVMMPEMDGFTVTKKIRENNNIPIIIITAKVMDSDKILGLNLGADDYLTKPFSPLEVVARVGSTLRRFYQLGGSVSNETLQKTNEILCVGDLELNTNNLILRKKGDEIIITPNEFKLLSFLMKSPGRVYTKSQLCEAVNGEYYDNYENSIMVHISHLRDKIEDDPKNPKYIINVRGIGYKIEKQR